MKRLLSVLSLGLIVIVVGCGPSAVPVKQVQQSPAEAAKLSLKDIAEDGPGGQRLNGCPGEPGEA